MKKGIFLLILLWGGVAAFYARQQYIQNCPFYRDGHCFSCDTTEAIPVGYKENCHVCPNRKAIYVEGGIVPAWQCVLKTQADAEDFEAPEITVGNKKCPNSRPVQDVVKNCYPCDVETPVRVADIQQIRKCGIKRYVVPDGITEKTLKCPALADIKDPESCVMCGGFINQDECVAIGRNEFCQTNTDCGHAYWCYPFRTYAQKGGVCVPVRDTKWLCSQTDGYDLKTTTEFCTRQKAHIPTLQEIIEVDEDLKAHCPTLDIWAFFAPDGVVWIESFNNEFLFTREGESATLGGNTFYALCHKD